MSLLEDVKANPDPGPEVFIAVWSGGYEEPQYQVFVSRAAAVCKVAEAWLPDYRESNGDVIDILRIDLDTLQITSLELNPREIAVEAHDLSENLDTVGDLSPRGNPHPVAQSESG